MGRLDFIISAFGLYIIPIAAKITPEAVKNISISHVEVEKVISVPLKFFMETEPEKYTINMLYDFPQIFLLTKYSVEKITSGQSLKWLNIFTSMKAMLFGLNSRNNTEFVLNTQKQLKRLKKVRNSFLEFRTFIMYCKFKVLFFNYAAVFN